MITYIQWMDHNAVERKINLRQEQLMFLDQEVICGIKAEGYQLETVRV